MFSVEDALRHIEMPWPKILYAENQNLAHPKIFLFRRIDVNLYMKDC